MRLHGAPVSKLAPAKRRRRRRCASVSSKLSDAFGAFDMTINETFDPTGFSAVDPIAIADYTDVLFPVEHLPALFTGGTYMNIATFSNSEGEIRGQITSLSAPPVVVADLCTFDGDTTCDAGDLDAPHAVFNTDVPPDDALFDLNSDNVVDATDLSECVR